MADPAPELIKINHDDFHAKHVGRTADGRQFFLTTPFVPLKWEFLALYLFDAHGTLIEAKIDHLGPRKHLDTTRLNSLIESRLSELGEVSFQFIEVAPFRVEKFGIEFGLIPRSPEEDEEDWSVTAEPGDYMAFYPPWDGEYDT